MMGAGSALIIECRQTNQPGRIDLTLYVPRQSQLEVTGGAFPVDVSGSLLGADINTTSGAIGYRVPATDDATIEARSGRGLIRSSVPLTSIERLSTSLRGQLGSGDAQIFLSSQTGNISLLPGIGRIAKGGQARPSTSGDSSAAPVQENTNQQKAQEQDNNAAGSATTSGGRMSPPQPAPQPQAGSGDIDFAGADRGDDGGSQSRSGPLTRQHQQRSTAGGNSGLRARIIRPDEPQASRDTGDVLPDSNGVDPNQQQTGGAGGGQQPPDPNQTTGGGGGQVFAGVDNGDDGSARVKGGPFERDRQKRTTNSGSSGLKIRIIPSSEPMNRVETITFPSPRSDANYSRPNPKPAQPATRASAGGGNPDRSRDNDVETDSRPAVNQQSRTRTTPLPESPANYSVDGRPNTSARSAPPLLHRPTLEEPPAPASATGPKPAASPTDKDEDEAISLKAALVNMNVSVTTRAGLALGNLKKEDFQITENGDNQHIEFFAPTTAPFNLVLVIDLSGSIKDKLDIIKSAALKFLDVLGSQDKVAVVAFTDEIRVVSQLTSDRDELKRRIKGIERPQGGTAFYEAMWFSLVDTLRGTQGQRNAIVVMTDGVDSSMDRYNPMDSRVSFAQLSNRLEESDVTVFPIYLDTEYEEVFERGNSTSEAYAIARDQLDRLADVTGGQRFKAEKASDLAGVYKQVAAAIRTVYSIGYQPTNPEKDGTFRRIRVSVNKADAAVRARKGYYAK
jgi:VWFA-related protein